MKNLLKKIMPVIFVLGLFFISGGAVLSATPGYVSTSATSITANSAVLNSSFTPAGLNTNTWFEVQNVGNQLGYKNIGSGTSPVSNNYTLSGLSASTTYSYRAVAQNQTGTTYSSWKTFTTSSNSNNGGSNNSSYTYTGDSTPRIAFWPGKVNQHVNGNGAWVSDPDGKSGGYSYTQFPNDYAGREVQYCQKWYPNTTSIRNYKNETITTWKRASQYEQSNYTKTVMSMECVTGGNNDDDNNDDPFYEAPTVNLTASPTSVAYGGTTYLTWNVSNATSCIASNGWTGSKNANGGSQSIGNMTIGTTFKLTCTGAGGSASDTVYVAVGSEPNDEAPTVNLTASPTSVAYGGTTYLTWNVSNATSCIASNGWTGSKNANGGSQSIGNMTYGTTFKLTCTGAGGTSSDTVYVSVDQDDEENLPSVTTNSATSIDEDSARLNGTVSSNGSGNVRAWFEWGTNSNMYNQTTKISYGSVENRDYSYSLGGLEEDTTYYFRAVAQNDNGEIVYGSKKSFTTDDNGGCNSNCNDDEEDPDVTTYSATDLGYDYAQLNGYVETNGNSTSKWFEYGTSSNNLNYKTSKLSYSSSRGNFNQDVYNLNPNTTYYFRAVAYGNGETVYGNILNFRTNYNGNENTCSNGISCIPTAVTTLATNVGYTSARLNGYGIVNGGINTNGYFEYGETMSLGKTTASAYIGNSQSSPFYSSLFGLRSNTTYYFRAVVVNQYGTSRGDIQTFRTNTYVTNTKTNTTTKTNTVERVVYREVIPVTNVIETNTNTDFGISKPSLVFLTINRNNETIGVGNTFEYLVNYKNVSSQNLRDLVLRVALPKEIEFVSASRGYFSEENNTVVVNIENLYPQEEGSVIVRVKVNDTAELGKIIVTTANMAYTIVENNNQEEVFAYSKNTIDNENAYNVNGTVAGAAIFGNGFLPNTLIGWLLLLLIILLIILALRMAYRRSVVINNNPSNPNHTI